MPFLQEIIHKIEVGAGPRFFRIGLLVLAVALLTVGYNWRGFKNMACQEAMDAAQVGRNISQGKGYTTLFIRPLSMYLLRKHALDTGGAIAGPKAADPSQIKGMHPDLANPPVYPFLLAGVMKVLPFRYLLPSKPKPFWSYNGKFWRYEPDFLIGLVNQLLFFGAITLTFFLARRLFDSRVAWLSAALLLGTELLWRFSVSGLVHDAVDSDLRWAGVVPGLVRRGGARAKAGAGVAARAGGPDRGRGRRGRSDTLRLRLADRSRPDLPDRVRREAAGHSGSARAGHFCRDRWARGCCAITT